MARNPLRLDPTRTGLLRRQFEQDLQKRFAALSKAVMDLLEREEPTVNYDPNQPRDQQGRWVDTGGANLDQTLVDSIKSVTASGGPDAYKYRMPGGSGLPLRKWVEAGDFRGLIHRGIGVSESEWLGMNIEPGGVIDLERGGAPISWTKDKARIGGYAGGRVALFFHGEAHGIGRDVEKWSHYPEEREVFIPYNSEFLVTRAEYQQAGGIWHIYGEVRRKKPPTVNAPVFKFTTSHKKVQAFNKWLQDQINKGILKPQAPFIKGQPWTATYVQSSYKTGALRAYMDARKPALLKTPAFYAGSKGEFLKSAFGSPEATSKLKLLYTRSYENLKGITSQMSSQMSRVFADAVAHGRGTSETAKLLTKTITGISKKRAMVLARTEIIHAHAEGQLDAFQLLGVGKVGAEVEFETSGDDGVCPECEELEGEIYTIAEARGIIPVHPNCLLPGTRASARRVVAAFRAAYCGDVVEIRFKSGALLTVTENHKLLGRFGFVSANALRIGDDVVSGGFGKVPNNPNNDDAPIVVEEIFNAAVVSAGCVSERVPAASKHFHGDGWNCNGYVDVVFTDGLLRSARKATPLQHFHKLPLCACWGDSMFLGLCDSDAVQVALSLAAHGVVGRLGPHSPLLGRLMGCDEFIRSLAGSVDGLRNQLSDNPSSNAKPLRELQHAGPVGVQGDNFGSGWGIGGLNPQPLQAVDNNPTGEPSIVHNFNNAFSGLPKFDKVAGLRRHRYSGHVYDLQTESGLYIANEVYTSNCRCSWAPVIKIKGKRR